MSAKPAMPVLKESVLGEEKTRVFHQVRLTIQFRDKVLAGIPKGGNALQYYLDTKFESDKEKQDFEKRVRGGLLTEEERESIKETSWCVFEKDHDGSLCLWHGNSKAMMREIFTTLGYTQIKHSSKDGNKHAGGKQTFQHMVHVDPLRITFHRPGEFETIKQAEGTVDASYDSQDLDQVQHKESDETPDNRNMRLQKLIYGEPDGSLDKVKHITDAAGTRSALGRHDYLFRPEMKVTLMWPKDGCYTEEQIRLAWSACEEDGLGACRSQGFGKFNVTSWKHLTREYVDKRERK